MNEPYTRVEIESIIARDRQAKPDRGEVCPQCSNHIPRFADISPEIEKEFKQRVANGEKNLDLAKELIDKTGCPLTWAKIWLIHLDGHHKTPPCPSCGKPLRTKNSQQCFHCGADWHGKPPQ